ncbi:MAG TPA: hypothetical protein VJI66_00445 [Candidatus Paceibacterota bacterium]
MNFVETWGEVFTQSLQGIWMGIASFVPTLVIAIIIFAIGWVLAALIEKLIEGLFKTFKIDAALKSAGLEDVVERSGHKLNSGRFVGSLVKWFVIVVFLIASFDILGLTQVNSFLKDVVLSYLPQVIVAVLVLMVAVVIADAVQKVVMASARAAHIKSAVLLGKIAKWAIWIFAILTALFHLGIAPALIQTLFMGVVVAAALACGLAFGLGGKEVAGRMLEKTIHTVSDKE